MIKTIVSKASWFLQACVITGLLCFFPVTAHAAQVSFSDPTCVQGEQVTVSVRVSPAVSGVDMILSYDSSKLTFVSGSGVSSSGTISGAGGSIRIFDYAGQGVAEFSFALTFKAENVGKAVIQIVGEPDITDENGDTLSVTRGSSQITITAPPTASSDASLTGLRINPGTLSPAFSSETTSYRASVGNETTFVAVSYTCAEGASAIYYGNEDLKVGDNRLVVKVTAEDGVTTKQYVVTITRAQAAATQPPETTQIPGTTQPPEGSTTPEESTEPPAILSMNTTAGDSRQIADFEESALPSGFQKTTIPYQGMDIPAATGSGAHPLVWLLRPETPESSAANAETGAGASEQAGDFWFYDADRQLAYPVSGLTGAVLQLMPIMPPADIEAPEGYELLFVQIKDETSVPVYAPIGVEGYNHYIIYAIDAEGNGGLYLYDCAQGTLQRYGFAITGETVPSSLPAETSLQPESSPKVPETSAATEMPGKTEQGGILKYIAIGVAVLVVIALIILVTVLVTSAAKTRRREQEERLDRESEEYLKIRPQTFEKKREPRKDEDNPEIKSEKEEGLENFSKLFDPNETLEDK